MHRVLVNDLEESVQLVHAVRVAREGGGEIEAEPVDVHVVHPIAQAVHDELERARMEQIEGVAGAGEIQVEPRIFRPEAVIGADYRSRGSPASGPRWLPSAV